MRGIFSGAIIIISAQSNIEEMLFTVSKGADDYFAKPFGMQEVTGKIRMMLSNSANSSSGTIKIGDLIINKANSLVTICDKKIELTPTEYSLLLFMAMNRGRLLTTEKLVKVLANPIEFKSQHLKWVIQQLKMKIEGDVNRPAYIVNESNVGYRFIGPLSGK